MNYDELKKLAATECRGPIATLKQAEQDLALVTKKIASEREAVENAELRCSKVKRSMDDALLGDRHGYERFKTSLKRRMDDLAVARELLQQLESMLPMKKANVEHARKTLGIIFDAFCARQRPEVEARMVEHFDRVLAERDDFLDAAGHLFHGHGLTMSVGRSSNLSPTLKHDRIDRVAGGCKITGRPLHDPTWKK